jgi:IS30 family transposase
MPENKHLTDEERLHIERLHKERVSIRQIALKLGRSTSTISREIRARAVSSDKSVIFIFNLIQITLGVRRFRSLF